MNKRLLVLLVSAGLILSNASVGQSKAVVAGGRSNRDTTLALVIHLDYALRGILWGPADRIKGDSMAIVQVSPDTWKKKKVNFLYYGVTVSPVVDSAIAKMYNIPVLDSLGRQYRVNLYIEAPAMYVRDSVTDFKKAYQSLEKYVIKDSVTIKK